MPLYVDKTPSKYVWMQLHFADKNYLTNFHL